jgi:hypothetical protein
MTPEVIIPALNIDTLFLICNYSVLPAWLLLAVLPGWSWTQKIVHTGFIPLLLGAVYTWIFASGALFGAEADPEAGMGSLRGLMLAFDNPQAVVAAWVHYLIFDLFVGAWEVRDARRRGINHLFVLPSLFFTLVAGPIGLILYLLTRLALRKGGLSLDESAE